MGRTRGLRRAVWLAACCGLIGLGGCKGDPGTKGDPGPAGKDGAAGPTGAAGPQGEQGEAAPTVGTLTGTVTDAVLLTALPNVAVVAADSGGTTVASATTNDTGSYSLALPFGVYSLKFTRADFTSPAPMLVGSIPGQTVTVNVTMAEAASGKPTVTLTAPADAIGYGSSLQLTATATDPQGDTLTYQWSNNTATVPALGTVTGTGATGTVTMPTMQEAFSRRENPGNPGEYLPGYTPEDRFGILPIFPDIRAQISAMVKVSDGRGQFTTASITVNATSVQLGVPTVAIGARVYLNSGKDDNNAWTLSSKPTGSATTLADAASRFPSFIPDKAGTYTVTEGTGATAKSLSIEAGSFKGVITSIDNGNPVSDSACTGCHNGTLATGNFNEWAHTRHSGIFTRGLNGADGTSSASCMDCHVVGQDKGANGNGGFDDVASQLNWKFPTNRTPGTYEALLANAATLPLARLGNIQCESCHGPNTSGNHMQTRQGTALRPYLSNRISYSSEACGTCHARTSHHLYSEWVTTRDDGVGHANRVAARDIGARGGTLNASCGRCHAAQGFVEFVKNVKAGKPGNLNATDNANYADVTHANVEPVTCTACHDPHDDANPNQLRSYGSTGLLPSGFALTGMGKGALCATCHNSRNGMRTGSSTLTYLHEDGETYNSGNPTGYSAPHVSAQADVFAGRNAYFMGSNLPMVSRHAAIENTCVGCHMELQPQTRIAHGEETRQSHLFRITEADMGKVCAECHAEGVSGEGTRAAIEAGLHQLEEKMGLAVKAKINGIAGGIIKVRAYDETSDLYSHSTNLIAIDVTANPVVHVGIVEGHGQIEFHLEFTNPVEVQLVDGSGNPAGAPQMMKEFGVQMGSLKDNQATPQAIYALSGNMVRAGWNYFLIHSDASEGMHNPAFAQQVINNTLAQDLSF